jgi:hypothetical protein
MKRFPLALLIIAIATTIRAASITTDNFNDDALNSALWSTVTRSTNATVVETNGALRLRQRGTLVTQRNFKTCDITGRFQIGTSDRLVVWTRTDASGTNPFADLDNGILFRVQKDNDTIGIDQWDYLNGGDLVLTQRQFHMPPTTFAWMPFRVTDDGTNCAFYLGSFDVPLLTATTTFRGGDKVAFNNNQLSEAALDDVRIESADTALTHHFIGVWYSTKAPPFAQRTAGEIELRLLDDGSLDVLTTRNGILRGSGMGTWRQTGNAGSRLAMRFTNYVGTAYRFTGTARRKTGQDYHANGTFRASGFRGKWQATPEE